MLRHVFELPPMRRVNLLSLIADCTDGGVLARGRRTRRSRAARAGTRVRRRHPLRLCSTHGSELAVSYRPHGAGQRRALPPNPARTRGSNGVPQLLAVRRCVPSLGAKERTRGNGHSRSPRVPGVSGCRGSGGVRIFKDQVDQRLILRQRRSAGLVDPHQAASPTTARYRCRATIAWLSV